MFLFTEHHIELIKKGEKCQTRRLHHGRFRAKVGSIHQCRTTLFGPALCHIRILRTWHERLGDISANDAWEEGGYDQAEYQIGLMEMHRGKVNLNTILECYEFELVKEAE